MIEAKETGNYGTKLMLFELTEGLSLFVVNLGRRSFSLFSHPGKWRLGWPKASRTNWRIVVVDCGRRNFGFFSHLCRNISFLLSCRETRRMFTGCVILDDSQWIKRRLAQLTNHTPSIFNICAIYWDVIWSFIANRASSCKVRHSL